MASFQESQKTQPSQTSNTENESRPLVFIHRSPNFKFSLNAWLQSRFRLLESDHPEFASLSQSVRSLVVVGPSPLTTEMLRQFPSLEIAVGSSAGVNHIDLAECLRRGIKVTNAGDAFSEDVADYAVGLLIDVLRRVSTADRFVRAGLWPANRNFPLGSKLGDKRVGIIGLGSIGSKIATRLQAFGCKIAYNSRNKKPHVTYPYFASVTELAAKSDALIVCSALTNETRHLINKDVMTSLGKNGVVVNVGRGALIDEKELVKFLVRGDIGGAGLDVHEEEPVVPQELFGLDNVVLSPHRAVTTPQSLSALQDVVIGNLEAFFTSKPLLSQIIIII